MGSMVRVLKSAQTNERRDPVEAARAELEDLVEHARDFAREALDLEAERQRLQGETGPALLQAALRGEGDAAAKSSETAA